MFSVARSYSSGFAEFNTTRRVFIWHDDLGIVFCSERHQKAVKPHVAAAWWESVSCDSLLTSRTGITVHDKYYSISAKCIQLCCFFMFFLLSLFFSCCEVSKQNPSPTFNMRNMRRSTHLLLFSERSISFYQSHPSFLIRKASESTKFHSTLSLLICTQAHERAAHTNRPLMPKWQGSLKVGQTLSPQKKKPWSKRVNEVGEGGKHDRKEERKVRVTCGKGKNGRDEMNSNKHQPT